MTCLLIALQDVKRALRDPAGLLMTLAVPFALIVAIGLVAGRAPFSPAPADGFDALSYIAPGMALFFMMFSARQAARTVVEDADRGVRDRLRASPASGFDVLAGSTLSHVSQLFLQLLVLVAVSTCAYGLSWGPVGPVLLVCLAAAVAGGGWVALLAAVGRTPSRVNALGTALTLAFGIASRSFAAVIPSAPWMDGLARLTPNYWGLHAFESLALGGGMGLVLRDCGVLLLMCIALGAIASLAGAVAPLGRAAFPNVPGRR